MSEEMITCVSKDAFHQFDLYKDSLENTQVAMAPIYEWPDAPKQLAPIQELAYDTLRTPELEQDESQLQLICYTLVVDPQGRYLGYYRKGKEGRLHGLFSLGFGGHMQLQTSSYGSFVDSLQAEIRRELQEEIPDFYSGEGRLSRVGFVYDQSSPVNRVHLGLVHVYEVPEACLEGHSDECGQQLWKTNQEILEEEAEHWTTLSYSLTTNWLRIRDAYESAGNHFTGMRPQGSESAYVSPERDMGAVVANALHSTISQISARIWPGLDELLYPGEFSERYEEEISRAMRFVSAFVESGARGGYAADAATVGDAFVRLGFFELPVRARALVLSHIGLTLLPQLWVSVRQYTSAGHEPEEQYRRIYGGAADFIRYALNGMSVDDHAVKFAARQQARKGISLADVLQMVTETYEAEAEALRSGG